MVLMRRRRPKGADAPWAGGLDMIDVDPAIKKMRWDSVFSMPRDELAAVVKAHQSINHQVNDAWHFYMKKSNLHSPDRHTHHSLTVFITQYADVILERYGPEFALSARQTPARGEEVPVDGPAKEEAPTGTRKRTCSAAASLLSACLHESLQYLT